MKHPDQEAVSQPRASAPPQPSLGSNLAGPAPPGALLLPVDSLFNDRPALTVNEDAERRLRNGASVPVGSLSDGEYRVYSRSDSFLALAAVAFGELRIMKSFFEV